ncbi:MAG: glycosyltransferase family 9 protein [Nitrospirales bacterium]
MIARAQSSKKKKSLQGWAKRFVFFLLGKRSEYIRKVLVKLMLRHYASWLPNPNRFPSPTDVRQVVLFGDMGIGNFIMFTPLLRAIREYFQEAEIVLLFTKKRGSDLVANRLDSIDRCIFLNAPAKPTIKALRNILVKLRQQGVFRPDVVVGRFSGSSYVPILACLLRGKWRVGHSSSAGYVAFMDRVFNYPVPMRSEEHEVERNLNLARQLGVPISAVKLEFPIFHNDEYDSIATANSHGLVFERLVCLQIGTSVLQSWKRWPAESWRELIEQLSSRGIQLALLGSTDERIIVDEIAQDHIKENSIVNLCGKMNLGATGDFLRRSRLLICNDSGLMHVGAAVGIPIIGLFGPTEYARTRPYAENVVAMRGTCHCNVGTLFDRVTVEKIAQCNRPCLGSIRAEDVAAETFKILRYPNG